jgi:hypothetical protein
MELYYYFFFYGRKSVGRTDGQTNTKANRRTDVWLLPAWMIHETARDTHPEFTQCDSVFDSTWDVVVKTAWLTF